MKSQPPVVESSMQPGSDLPKWQATRILRETKRRMSVVKVAQQDWSSNGLRNQIFNLVPVGIFVAMSFATAHETASWWILLGSLVAGYGLVGYWVAWRAMNRLDAITEVLRSNGTLERFERDIDVNLIPPPSIEQSAS